MKVLLAADSAVLRRSVAQALADRGHDVRVLIRTGDGPPTHWPARVEPWAVTEPAADALTPAAAGCDAAILVDPRVARVDRKSDSTSLVSDTSVAALQGLGLRCLVVGPRLADGPTKTRADGAWLRVQCDAVYGTGEDALSLFLIMMRTLPAVPLLSETHALRPLWHEDLARGLAAALSAGSAPGDAALEFEAPEATTYDALYERLAAMIDRRPARMPIPDFVAAHGSRLADVLHLSLPYDPAVLAAAAAPASGSTTLRDLGIVPTPLDTGLRRLANELPEIVPSEGVGRMEMKRFFAEITGSPHTAPELLRLMRSRFGEVMPIPVGVEPVSPLTRLDPDGVVTMNLPARGHVQIRVAEVTDEHVVAVTLHGHALAGCVRFSARPTARAIHFEVMTCESASNTFDWLTLSLGGGRLQDANWKTVVQNVVTLSGGQAAEVQSEARRLSADEAERTDRWIRDLVEGRPGSGLPAAVALNAPQ